ncbi:MAG TPA: sortase [Candidatus Saccharibacteria bacterium]|nr:sortase [Candidatus Saccharibacteria bacterium]
MRPEDTKLTGGSRGHIQPPQRAASQAQDAVANIARGQIDAIYNSNQATQPHPQEQPIEPQPQHDSAYTTQTHQQAHSVPAKDWQQYHSAWQNYYQKYYEHYYVGAVKQAHEQYAKQAQQPPAEQPAFPQPEPETMSKDEAMYDLRNQLVSTVNEQAKKVRKSRHFIPAVAALSVLLLFIVLQFNSIIIANVKAYVTPGEIDPQNIIVDPTASLQVSKEPRLIIPKINVNVPVEYNVTPDQSSQLKAMEKGVAWFGIAGANSKPGQVGNTVISGHSSNDFIESGDYKFVFALLERMKKGDTFYLHYNGIRYTYTVTKTQVVQPNNVKALVYPTKKPIATLITCTPLGTALNRLLVTAEQVSPDPSSAKSAPSTSSQADSSVAMPGNSPTLLERLFGAGN